MNKSESMNQKGAGFLIAESMAKVLLVAIIILALGWGLVQLGAWMD